MIRFLLACFVLFVCWLYFPYSCQEDVRSSLEIAKLPHGTIVYTIRGYFVSEEFEFKSANDKVKSKTFVFRKVFDADMYSVRLECYDEEIVIAYLVASSHRAKEEMGGEEHSPQILVDSIDGKRIRIKYLSYSPRVYFDSNGYEVVDFSPSKQFGMFDSSENGIAFTDNRYWSQQGPIHCE